MRITLVFDTYPPNMDSIGKMAGDLAAVLVRLGHTVTVLTLKEDARELCEVVQDGRLTVLRVRTGRLKRAPLFVRGLNEMRLSSLFWSRMKKHLRATKCDLIVYSAPSIFFGPLITRLKALWGAKSYLVQRDIFPEWAVEAGILSKGIVYRYLKWWARRSYGAADRIGLESEGSHVYFNRIFKERGYHTEVLYNWYMEDAPEQSVPHYRKQLGFEDKVVFFYGGNIGVAQDIDNLLRLSERLANDVRAHFLFVGNGSEVSRINERITSGSLTNVTMLPSVSQAEYFSMLKEFDIGLISLNCGLKASNIPGKMMGYMACGLPILASVNANSDLPRVIGNANAGLCCLNGDDDTLMRNALALVGDAQLRRLMGRNSRKLLEDRFRPEIAAHQILHLIDTAAKAPSRDGDFFGTVYEAHGAP